MQVPSCKREENYNRMKETIILGIDPGTAIMGYGIIKVVGKKMELVVFGNIDLTKYKDHYLKLQKIFFKVGHLIDNYHPDEMAIEAPFFGKNVQSMLKLGRAQGVAMSAALTRDIPITEYAPLKIKQSITGSGSASKEQVAAMLQRMLKFAEMPKNLDATDGLAAAVCHFYQKSNPLTSSGGSSWKEFISRNPDRVK
jgi:crossover junction endodeoxyribonuclease RuvC